MVGVLSMELVGQTEDTHISASCFIVPHGTVLICNHSLKYITYFASPPPPPPLQLIRAAIM